MSMPSATLKVNRRKKGISLTPLIDVVFILLVFFMLASSFEKHQTVDMMPPAEGKAQTVASNPDITLIEVAGPGQYKVLSETLSLASLEQELVQKRDEKILIKILPLAALQDLVALLDLTAKLKLEKVSLLPYQEETP